MSSKESKVKSKTKSKTKSKNSCKKGEIYRNSYIRKTKSKSKSIKVPGSCIRSTSQTGLKRSVIDKKYFEEKAKSQNRAKHKTKTKTKSKSCSKGEIMRSAYERKKYVKKAYTKDDGTKVKASIVRAIVVPSGCVKDKGAKGHGKQLFHLDEDVLGKFGYKNVKQKTQKQRHTYLNRALAKGIKPLPLFRRLNALYVLNKNQDPVIAKIFKQDRDYIKTTDAYLNRPTAKKNKSKTKSKTNK